MANFIKKEKINYFKGTKINLDKRISSDNINIKHNINNNINTTLTNISEQLKNISMLDKSKETKILNASFRINKNSHQNSKISNNNKFNSSLNQENNPNQIKNSFLDFTDNLKIIHKFQGLKKSKAIDFNILKMISNESGNINYEEIKKENLELKENIKFLMKQIRKYQKNQMTIEDLDSTRLKELDDLEKRINEIKQFINKYKKKMILLENINKELSKENKRLKICMYINDNKRNGISEKENQDKYSSLNIKNYNRSKNIRRIQNIQVSEPFNDLDDQKEKTEINNDYNKRKRNFHKNDINSSFKLRQKLLWPEMNTNCINKNSQNNVIDSKLCSNQGNYSSKLRNNLLEDKIYCRKNIGKTYFNLNNESHNSKNNNEFTYSRSHLNNNINFNNII